MFLQINMTCLCRVSWVLIVCGLVLGNGVSAQEVDSTATLVSGEYFIDTDPGFAMGTVIPVSEGQTATLNVVIPAGSLSLGFHTLYVRFKNKKEQWGLTTSRALYVGDSEQPSPVAALEYFIGDEPGVGKGTGIEVEQADSVTVTPSLATAALVPGDYVVTVRARNAIGNWGLGTSHAFSVQVGNVAPSVIDSIGPVTLARGETFTQQLNTAFVDADGDTMSFSAISSDEAVATVQVAGDSVTIAGLVRGSATVLIGADDGKGNVTNLPVAVTVPNALPVVVQALADVSLTLGGDPAVVDLSGVFKDGDEDALTFSASSSDEAVATAQIVETALRVTPVAEGNATVIVTASDGKGGSARDTLQVAVTDVPFSGLLLVDLNASSGNQNVSSAAVKVGDTVTVQLYADGFPEIIGFGFTLSYDPSALTFVSNSFAVGDFVSGVTPLLTDQNGVLEIGAASLGGGNSGSGSGLLGSFMFEVGSGFSQSSQMTVTSLGATLLSGVIKKKNLQIVLSLTEKSGLAGDFDGDGSVGFGDFLGFAGAFGKESTTFDLDGDGRVGFGDFLIFATNFGKSSKVTTKPAVEK